jgi:hypothetical protein
MNDVQFGALREAAPDGVACDGLRVEREANGYVFETPEETRAGLDAAAFEATAAANPWFVSNWHYWQGIEDPARRAYLRWLERADEHGVRERYEALATGVRREWGQLGIEAGLDGDGERIYELRHAADADREIDALDVRADPLDAREIATEDPKGRYRPLKTAPTLRRGWAFAALDGRDLYRAVDFFYPATVANWFREREGDLDVTHYRETATRQTGIYGIVDGLAPEAVGWLAEACCVDSQCLKRREWDESEAEALGVPRGDGEFPCREPCSLVIAAARKLTLLEREGTRTYEFELTPSEKEQLEALVDTVAEGRIDDVREADLGEGANRYRTRFLRAKRMDEEGRLCGVPTREDDWREDGGDDGERED